MNPAEEKPQATERDSVTVAKQQLKEISKSSCQKCHGRGFIGTDVRTGGLIPCMPCLRRHARLELEKEKKVRELKESADGGEAKNTTKS